GPGLAVHGVGHLAALPGVRRAVRLRRTHFLQFQPVHEAGRVLHVQRLDGDSQSQAARAGPADAAPPTPVVGGSPTGSGPELPFSPLLRSGELVGVGVLPGTRALRPATRLWPYSGAAGLRAGDPA